MAMTHSQNAVPAWEGFEPGLRGPCVICFGHLDLRAEVEFASALRPDTPR